MENQTATVPATINSGADYQSPFRFDPNDDRLLRNIDPPIGFKYTRHMKQLMRVSSVIRKPQFTHDLTRLGACGWELAVILAVRGRKDIYPLDNQIVNMMTCDDQFNQLATIIPTLKEIILEDKPHFGRNTAIKLGKSFIGVMAEFRYFRLIQALAKILLNHNRDRLVSAATKLSGIVVPPLVPSEGIIDNYQDNFRGADKGKAKKSGKRKRSGKQVKKREEKKRNRDAQPQNKQSEHGQPGQGEWNEEESEESELEELQEQQLLGGMNVKKKREELGKEGREKDLDEDAAAKRQLAEVQKTMKMYMASDPSFVENNVAFDQKCFEGGDYFDNDHEKVDYEGANAILRNEGHIKAGHSLPKEMTRQTKPSRWIAATAKCRKCGAEDPYDFQLSGETDAQRQKIWSKVLSDMKIEGDPIPKDFREGDSPTVIFQRTVRERPVGITALEDRLRELGPQFLMNWNGEVDNLPRSFVDLTMRGPSDSEAADDAEEDQDMSNEEAKQDILIIAEPSDTRAVADVEEDTSINEAKHD